MTIILLVAVTVILGFAVQQCLVALKKLKPIQTENEALNSRYSEAADAEKLFDKTEITYAQLQQTYSKARSKLKAREKKAALHDIGIGTMDVSAYKPLYEDISISELEQKLMESKERIKEMIRDKTACICRYGGNLEVNGKRSLAKKLLGREVRLRIRCLDNEFSAANALATWNNINRLIQRAKNACADINESGKMLKTQLTDNYLHEKIIELRLTYDIKNRKALRKEAVIEKRQMAREAEREEGRIKAAAEKSSKERKKMEALIAKAMNSLNVDSDEQKEKLALYQQELQILKEREGRAVSMAQITRSGYVYVISNVKSFGEGICKIGMTRRVDPRDRVKELGDASVPEYFDVHAFIYTDDAPKLEKYLHNAFSESRMNLVNMRKEFFRVGHAKILEEMKSYDGPQERVVF